MFLCTLPSLRLTLFQWIELLSPLHLVQNILQRIISIDLRIIMQSEPNLTAEMRYCFSFAVQDWFHEFFRLVHQVDVRSICQLLFYPLWGNRSRVPSVSQKTPALTFLLPNLLSSKKSTHKIKCFKYYWEILSSFLFDMLVMNNVEIWNIFLSKTYVQKFSNQLSHPRMIMYKFSGPFPICWKRSSRLFMKLFQLLFNFCWRSTIQTKNFSTRYSKLSVSTKYTKRFHLKHLYG